MVTFKKNIKEKGGKRLADTNNARSMSRWDRKTIISIKRSLRLDRWWNHSTQSLLIAVVTGILIAFILSPDIKFFTQRYNVGDIASHDIKSTKDLLIEDVASTVKKREEASKSIKSIYDLDRMVFPELMKRLRTTFNNMKAFYDKWGGVEKIRRFEKGLSVKKHTGKKVVKEGLSPKPSPDPEEIIGSLESMKEQFFRDIGIRLSDKEYKSLEDSGFNEDMLDRIAQWLKPVFGAGLVANKELLSQDRDKGIIIRDLQTKEEKVVTNIDSLYDLKEAKGYIKKVALEDKGMDRSLKAIALKLAEKSLMPNLTFNKSATEERGKEILASVKPVYFQIKKGEIIIREGARITKDDLVKLQGLFEESAKQKIPLFTIGIILLSILIFLTSYQFSSENIRKFRASPKDLLLMSLILIGTLLLIEFGLFISQAFEENFPVIPAKAYVYAIPVVAGAMLVRLFLNSETALIFSAVLSLFSAMVLDKDLFFAIYFFLGSILGAGGLKHATQRVTIIKAGVIVGIVNMGVILSFGIVNSGYGFEDYLIYMPFGFVGGVIASIVVTGITPIIEHGLGYTTNIKLLELARMDHPLLKELALNAPGTYHHSIIIGSLVEAAAEAIYANPLLAKVSAFYHDIGKMKKPLYFIENQRNENRHERLTPSMSALILISHVKEGVEMAKAYKLGKEIIDIIKEHHGTSLITYFYQKAKEGEDPEVHEIKEKDFRYPGPKPQTKEAGLVMLADAVEAACKTIPDPTPAKVKGAVYKIINKIFTDGQLDECELTLRDLNKISEVFTRIMNGIYHSRIDYPEPAYIVRDGYSDASDRGKKAHGDNSSKQAERDRGKVRELKRGGRGGIKSIGSREG